jgi:hypothetical protein
MFMSQELPALVWYDRDAMHLKDPAICQQKCVNCMHSACHTCPSFPAPCEFAYHPENCGGVCLKQKRKESKKSE